MTSPLSVAYNTISEKGLLIPADISAMGYDGNLISAGHAPQLVTYQQNTEALGRTAAEKLIELIESPRTALPEQILVSGRLLDGAVRGCPQSIGSKPARMLFTISDSYS